MSEDVRAHRKDALAQGWQTTGFSRDFQESYYSDLTQKRDRLKVFEFVSDPKVFPQGELIHWREFDVVS